MREPIWSSIDGQSWQLVIVEPFRCSIYLGDSGDLYMAAIVNMETRESSLLDFPSIEEAKDWCIQASKGLAAKLNENTFEIEV